MHGVLQVAKILHNVLGPAVDAVSRRDLDVVYKQVFKFLLTIWECREKAARGAHEACDEVCAPSDLVGCANS